MAKELLLPELAESVVEGEIVRWLVAEGESVALDQPVAEVLTDKATVELPSPYAGVVIKHLAAEGDVVQVNTAIALIAEGGEPQEAVQKQAKPDAAAQSPVNETDDGESLSLFKPSSGQDEALPQVRIGNAATKAQTNKGEQPRTAAAVARGAFGRVVAVPAARKLARELGVDVEEVIGSGPHGRVRVADVQNHSAPAPTSAGGFGVPAVQYSTPSGYEHLEERTALRGLRRVISNQMVASHLHTSRVLHVDEADVTELVALREKLKPRAAARGVRLSYLPFIMKAVATALGEYPMLNTSLDEASNEIVTKRYYNLGMAVATANGLVVPVVQAVDSRTIIELAADINRLADAAKAGKLTPDDLKAGTFSITNIGSVGGLFSFPLINVPQAAILGVHSIKKRPVVMPDDSIQARQMLYLSLSFDHRLIDGAEGAMFTSRVIDLIENPEALMLDL